jgi:hypothetical protein
MTSMAATPTDFLSLPADLSAKAQAVPGLQARLLRFIRMEVALNERRQQRYSPEARALVLRARERLVERKKTGMERTEGMRAFEQNFSDICDAL